MKDITDSERLTRLEERVAALERQRSFFTPPPVSNQCPRCGIKLDQVMGYCCPVPHCPTGLGPVMC